MTPEGGDRRGDKEREVILLGILNIESVYGKEWVKKKKEVKKDLQSRSVMLNQAFKNPHIFHERFEFLSADDYSCVKNNYIYSAIVIFNPNLGGNSSGGEEPVSEGGHMGEDAPAGQAKVKNTCVVSGGQHTRHAAQGGAASLCGGSTCRPEKKEGVGVLVVTCKKTDSEKMKNILVKMLKKEIRVECTALKCKDGHFSSLSHVRREERDVRGKHTEIRYLDRPPASPAAVQSSVQSGVQSSAQSTLQSTLQFASPPAPSAANKPFNVSRNNFFNMTAYIYGSSNLLANSSLILREYGDDEWAERLRRTKKGKEQAHGGPSPPTGAHDASEPREGGLIKTFTSLFKK
ncbi:conserved Plasmodium protein, unknown function [Plasmodium vivax]|uniref:Uncharacterized protein n=4 Tax=Plasmodium vivax TaxID=5855 RepID=A5KAG1_PLAVS|nr:hypothetical protein, conserved [Plasmodium vivax]KMZ89091.1 hypothetical protein PVBG_03055 [Plasmodium vivax Brazil I]KMZ95307.1 hypothetical protein PVMG_05175 [Plasmodium vivax Mauritania I]EDL43560.1 hypothetical protein, conserved [Plasmodium vivax]CAI7718176.1 conserved Plasmodium protein, unknown function [Plasmodium vivax]VUZ93573.1 conserved Plasmodium protein, unknown function [Plasmodium vivax]|eukprot:XP_001613287.1 hypothetical protein [Plasmodium vivax Sal-1]